MDGQLHVLTGDHACAYWCLNMCHREETTVQFQGWMAGDTCRLTTSFFFSTPKLGSWLSLPLMHMKDTWPPRPVPPSPPSISLPSVPFSLGSARCWEVLWGFSSPCSLILSRASPENDITIQRASREASLWWEGRNRISHKVAEDFSHTLSSESWQATISSWLGGEGLVVEVPFDLLGLLRMGDQDGQCPTDLPLGQARWSLSWGAYRTYLPNTMKGIFPVKGRKGWTEQYQLHIGFCLD